MKRQAKQIDYQSLSASDLVWLAQVDNDQHAIDEIYARKTVIAVRIARNYCRRYTFVDVDDLSQSLLMGLPKIIRTYRPGKATDWDKYCYHRLFYSAKDVLRQRDDLGIMWPQKKAYPEFHRLGDKSLENYEPQDHRDLDPDAIDLERLYEHVEAWRAAFEVATKPQPKKRTKPEQNESLPVAWVNGKYFGQAQISRKPKTSIDIARWKVIRAKPKQMVMFK